MRVDTNGSWDPELYDAVPVEVRGKTQLNVSFHPTQITFDRFKTRLSRIVHAGWQVGMINYVMEAGQAGQYEAVRDHYQREHGIYVNPNPDAFDDAWASALPDVREQARRKLSPLLPAADILRKTGAPTKGKACSFPSIAYFIGPNGVAQRACGVKAAGDPPSLDFIRDSAQVRALSAPVRCPQRSCLCLDRYAFLEELEDRGRSLNLLAEYVGDCTSHQEKAGRSIGRRAARAWASVSAVLPWRKKAGAASVAAPPQDRRRLVVVQSEAEQGASKDDAVP
jgi:hypothetical protein